MDRRKEDRHLYKCRANSSGFIKRKKQKRQKRERKKLQLSQEKSKLPFYSGSEVQRRHFCGACRRTEIEEHAVTDLDLRNDENRSSLTSGAVVEERQEVSSKNTMYEIAEAITTGNDIGLWEANTPKKCGNIG